MAAAEAPVYESALLQGHAERSRNLRDQHGTLRPLGDFVGTEDDPRQAVAQQTGRRCGRVFRCSCGRCVAIWARDRRRVWSQALKAAPVPLGMLTVTAPGSDLLPWACEPGDHLGKCEGPRGCRVDTRSAWDWNSTSAGRRKRMWRAMTARLTRKGLRRVVYGYVWEPQQRGVGHLHIVVALHALPIVLGVLRKLAPAYGFGFIDDARSRPKGGGSEGIARYVAGYLNGGSKVEQVVAAVERGVIPHRSWYVAPFLTRRTGTNMRLARRVRRWWATRMGLLPPAADTGCGQILGMLDGGPAPKAGGRRAPPSAVAEAARLWRIWSQSNTQPLPA